MRLAIVGVLDRRAQRRGQLADIHDQLTVVHRFDRHTRQNRLSDAFDLHEQLMFVNAHDGTEGRTVFTLEQLITNLDGYALGHG